MGEVSINNSAGDRLFFAIPNGTTDISSIELESGGVFYENIGAFSTTTATYTNSNSYAETYKIWYSPPQGGGTNTWKIS